MAALPCLSYNALSASNVYIVACDRLRCETDGLLNMSLGLFNDRCPDHRCGRSCSMER
jgi:hypothetical protein